MTAIVTTRARTVDAYLARLPAEKRKALEKVRRAVRAAAPGAEECISYGMPAFRLNGRLIAGFRAAARHCSYHPMSGATVATLASALEDYDTSPGTVRFSTLEGLPAAIVRKLVAARIAELDAPRRRRPGASARESESRVREFVAKFDPAHQKLIRAVRRAMRARFRGAFELVYDNYNFFVIGYSPTERPSDSVISITANSSGVGLCFVRGVDLPDPRRLLRGSGNQTRSIRVPSAALLETPPVRALLDAAERRARVPFSGGKTTLVIRSVSAKQRPRRRA